MMPYRSIKRALLPAAVPLAALALAACHAGHAEPGVRHAWVRLPAVAGQPAAAYFELEGGRRATTLVAIASAVAGRVEMHESMAGMNGMTAMKPLPAVPVPAGGRIAFAPGGRHAMLFALEPAIVPGTAVPLRFAFPDGTTAEAEAKTVAAGQAAPY